MSFIPEQFHQSTKRKKSKKVQQKEIQKFDAVNHWGIQASGIMVMLVTAAVLFFGIFPNWLAKIVASITIY